MPLKDVLKTLRYKAGYTQSQLAERIGISTQGYQKYEYGQAMPAPDKIKPLAEALNVTPEHLLAIINKPSTPGGDVRVDHTAQMIDVPILSREVVACCGRGQPVLDITSPAEPGIQIPRSRLHRYDDSRPPYAIYADGDCLESEGIEPGDQIVINPAEEPAQGAIALVSLYGMLSLKFFYRLGNGVICLRSDRGDQRLTPEDQDAADFFIVGVLVGTFKPRPRPRPF
jgi:transcriptional regulator with XRE-family HTH domain